MVFVGSMSYFYQLRNSVTEAPSFALADSPFANSRTAVLPIPSFV